MADLFSNRISFILLALFLCLFGFFIKFHIQLILIIGIMFYLYDWFVNKNTSEEAFCVTKKKRIIGFSVLFVMTFIPFNILYLLYLLIFDKDSLNIYDLDEEEFMFLFSLIVGSSIIFGNEVYLFIENFDVIKSIFSYIIR